MSGYYEITFFDENLVPQGLFQGWEYIEFTQRVNAPWNHNIRLKTSNDDAMTTFLRNADGMVDWIFLVHRVDPVAGIEHLVYEGFNRTIVDQFDSKGNIIFNLYGVGFTELLQRRIVLPPTGLETLAIAGYAETVMKEFVRSQCINPADPTRKIPNLSNEVDSSSGNTVSYSARYTILNTVVDKCAVDGEVDYGVVGGNPFTGGTVGNFEFQVRPTWGLDRRVGNIYGNAPTIFDASLNNMSVPIYSVNSSGEKNYVYVGGQGQGINREIRQGSNVAGIAKSPWNRREDFADARLESTTAALDLYAADLLEANKISRSLTFNVIQTLGMRWGVNWNLGDIITSRYYEVQADQKITEVTVRIGSGSSGMTEFIAAEFTQLV